jgi:signal-transduction protein with cAMP-binding, CBS, and nucleotidyltransferase domain
VLRRVIANGLDPNTTTVGEVMTWPSLTVTTDADAQEALALMFSKHQCYLPVVDLEGSIKGWLAICQLFQNNLEDLNRQLDSIEAYLSADGPGG